ncbi:MAG: TIGR02996 domain-containing protein [Planctomycetes bacterium]|nr:TIGR02996 domain-containing protein [Planctomycetota bacterium]
MLHTHDDFLSAIAAQPGDRVLRLVYADWLDERSDPRGELVRVEEEMRELPVFADRFWELKPRRNALRAQVGTGWCGKLRYGTECEPVFRHGVPDGWRERWRLIREFTERWHHVPMPDVGGRQKEITDVESRLKLKLPPSVREWVTFEADCRLNAPDALSFWHETEVNLIDGGRFVSLSGVYDQARGIQIRDLGGADPAVYSYGHDEQSGVSFALRSTAPVRSSVTELALYHVVRSNRYGTDYFLFLNENRAVVRSVENLPFVARFGDLTVHEAPEIIATIGQWMLWLKVSPVLDFDTIPVVMSDFIREWDRRRAAGESDPIPF